MPDSEGRGFSRRDFFIAASAAGVGGVASHLITKQIAYSSQAAATPKPPASPPPTAPETPANVPGQPPAMNYSGPMEPPNAESPDAEVPKPTKKLGWAIVGLGKLALEEVLPAFAGAKYAKLAALVSGHPEKAQQVAQAYGLDPKNIYGYDSYESLRDNPDVDIVYIILPNAMHAEFTIRGFKAGKHVLCEKPMAPTIDECNRMIEAGQQAGKKLMIAYRLRYEPHHRKAIEMCRKKELGVLRTFEASHVQVTNAPNIRLSAKLAGGPLGDIGIYCINAARYIVGEEPVEVTGMAHQPSDEPQFREVPAGYAFTMRFPSGVLAHCDCHFGAAKSARFRVHCAEGWIDMDPAFPYQGLEMRVNRKEGTTTLQIEEVNQFTSEMDAFSAAVMNDKAPETPGEEGLADVKVIKAIEEAARSGRTVKVV